MSHGVLEKVPFSSLKYPNALERAGSLGFALTAQKAGNRLKDVKAKRKHVTASANYRQKSPRVRAAESQASPPDPRESRKLLARAFSHPEGSSERRQVFSEYLDALHDEHAK
jgi:hypothetical protein